MSEADLDNQYRGGQSPHHHHHHHSKKAAYEAEYKAWYAGYVGYMLCCFAVALVFVFLILSIFYYSQTNHLHGQFSQMSARVAEMGVHTASLVALGSHERRQIHRLCHLSVYYDVRGDATERLTQLTRLNEVSSSADLFYYPVSAYLTLEYNADSDAKLAAQLGMPEGGSRKYQSIVYNITSGYQHFSSVRLREVEFDLSEHALRPLRELELCSDAPQAQALRCDKFKHRELFLLQNTKLAPVFHAPATPKPAPKAAVASQFDAGAAAASDYYWAQRELVTGIRLYSLAFYVRAQGEKRDRDAPFNEREVLVVEPTQC